MTWNMDQAILLGCGVIVTWLTTVGMPKTRLVAFALIAFALLVPLPRFTVFDIIVATLGTLSVTTIANTVMVAMSRNHFVMPEASRAEFVSGMALLTVVGGALYASTFGFTLLDLYSFGFDERNFTLLAAPRWLFAIFKRWMWFVITIPLVAIAVRLQLLQSANWWDYVIDPVYWAVAMGKLVQQLWLGRRVATV